MQIRCYKERLKPVDYVKVVQNIGESRDVIGIIDRLFAGRKSRRQHKIMWLESSFQLREHLNEIGLSDHEWSVWITIFLVIDDGYKDSSNLILWLPAKINDGREFPIKVQAVKFVKLEKIDDGFDEDCSLLGISCHLLSPKLMLCYIFALKWY